MRDSSAKTSRRRQGVSAENKALLFLKKKKQKDFLYWGMGVGVATALGPDSKKFLRRFFQKAAAFFI
jgi:hypothetical protein